MTIQPTSYSILELALVSKGHSMKETFNNVLDLAQHAETFGYTRFWLAEHHNSPNIGSSATSVLIGYVAASTNALRIGSGGIMLPNHSPLIIAEELELWPLYILIELIWAWAELREPTEKQHWPSALIL